MGKQWVGFQSVAKPVPGHTHVESARLTSSLPDADIVALLSTRAGLERWLGQVRSFNGRQGGSIDFSGPDGTFGGSYTLLDIPRRVVLVTDRHGELDFRMDVRVRPLVLSVRVTRFMADEEDAAAAQALMREVIDAIGRVCANGR